jgi:hypothetical protein
MIIDGLAIATQHGIEASRRLNSGSGSEAALLYTHNHFMI